ncbi:MAG: hypothetical protein ABSC48_01690 [Terracidiphilus sp.]|jgi:hypothetical protein
MSANEFGLRGALSTDDEPAPVEKCDVSNFELLSEYRKKRDEWLNWYSFRKDKPNNIQGQIIGMVFLDLSYRVLAKPRGDMSSGADIAARSHILAHMLDQGYVATQVLAIRRLLDQGRKGGQVFSIGDCSTILRRIAARSRAKTLWLMMERLTSRRHGSYYPPATILEYGE